MNVSNPLISILQHKFSEIQIEILEKNNNNRTETEYT